MEGLKIRAMSQEEFTSYMDSGIKQYSKDLLLSGRCTEDNALEEAKADFDNILTQGFNTPNNEFLIFSDGTVEVGTLWYCIINDTFSFIGDIAVSKDLRGKGYGTIIINYLEQLSREKGLKAMLLNVFDHNTGARRLYERLGFTDHERDIGCKTMIKRL